MKVLHVLKSSIYSGAEHVVCTIIKNMPDEYECLYLSQKGPIEQRLRKEHIAYKGVDKLTVSNIKKTIKEFQPDIVHAHDFTASVLCAMACASKQKLISHIHCNPKWIQSRNLKTILYHMACKKFDRIVTVSDAIKEEYIYASDVKDKFVTLGNPFSADEVIEKSKQSDSMPECDVIYVGRLSDEKNPLCFIGIIAKLKEKKDDIFAIMTGDGDLKDECECLIQNKSLQDNIMMVGFQENPYVYMKKAKVICIPSKWEGFGLVALEAMALGVPVVCSGVGGLQALLDNEYCVVSSSIAEYAEKIWEILEHEKNVLLRKNTLQEHAIQFSNVEKYKDKLIEIYGG